MHLRKRTTMYALLILPALSFLFMGTVNLKDAITGKEW